MNPSNVITLGRDVPFVTQTEIDPDNVLDGARTQNLETIIVVGQHEDGTLYLASSEPDKAHIALFLERAKAMIMDCYKQEDYR